MELVETVIRMMLYNPSILSQYQCGLQLRFLPAMADYYFERYGDGLFYE